MLLILLLLLLILPADIGQLDLHLLGQDWHPDEK
jgi:hypothetical protein